MPPDAAAGQTTRGRGAAPVPGHRDRPPPEVLRAREPPATPATAPAPPREGRSAGISDPDRRAPPAPSERAVAGSGTPARWPATLFHGAAPGAKGRWARRRRWPRTAGSPGAVHDP